MRRKFLDPLSKLAHSNISRKLLKPLLNLVHYSIFGLWNLCFLVVLYLIWLPAFGVDAIQAIASGEIQREFAITLIGFLAIPPICTAIAYTKLRKKPLAQTRLFFGIEAPLFLLCLLRFFVLRELNPASFWLLGSLLVAIAAFSLTQITGYWGDRPGLRHLAPLQAVFQTFVIMMGVYAGTLLMLYVVPIAGFVVTGLWGWITSDSFWPGIVSSVQWLMDNLAEGSLDYIIQSLLGTTLLILSVAFFLALPTSFILLYVDSGRQILRKFAAQRGRKTAMMLGLATLTAWIAIAGGLNHQPQGRAFALLERPLTPKARQALIAEAPAIRDGLLNAYLHPYRYLGVNQDSANIKWLYGQAFNAPEGIAQALQEVHDLLLFAFFYNGDRDDNDRARDLYAQFFDTPIQKGEQAAILKSLKSTTMLDAANAGVLNIGEEKVHLERQDLTVTPDGDWADVELHEVYVNQTFEVEEIFYSFSLPESAVITGIWLGETETLSDRFPFQVAPRGAAQAVYNSQVQRERPIDPALLEQVGPRNYRLRAFPIPAQPDQWERNNGVEPAQFHLWLTYRTLRSTEGWPLPHLSEARNVFWDATTERFRNGAAVQGLETWLETAIPTESDRAPQPHTATLAGYTVTAEPLADVTLTQPQGKRVAIVLDSSYSMNEQRQALAKTVQWLQDQGLTDGDLANNEADVYVATAAKIEPYAVPRDQIKTLDRTLFYGTVQLKTMVRQFEQLRQTQAYDAVILLSDSGSYELADDSDRLPDLNLPLWTVHLGNDPAAYDDAILAAMQTSGGGAASSVAAVFDRMAQIPGQATATVEDGYLWNITPTDNPAASQADGFTPFAARFLIHHLSRTTDTTNPEQLDQLHAIAQNAAIVTPYSSMIVLVNDEQREMLKAAEQGEDRFNRTVEDGHEALQEPPSVMGNTGVPEPGTWLAALLITLLIISQRRRFAR
jgi:putative PEP-CTERM system integral membrane protein